MELSLMKSGPRPSSRLGTAAITVHFPERVRRQLKAMAADEGRTMDDAIGEALNLLFARHGRPEIAPRKAPRSSD